VWTFSLQMSFAFGRPSCGRALRCVGAPNLRTCGRALRLHCGRALGRPTCGRALRCIGAPNLRMCLVLRLGTHLANVPCVALGHPICGRDDVPCVADVPCVCVADIRWGAQIANVPCVVLGRPTCGQALCCVWVPILRTCLALSWGAQPW
jgi:hypothetical protein